MKKKTINNNNNRRGERGKGDERKTSLRTRLRNITKRNNNSEKKKTRIETMKRTTKTRSLNFPNDFGTRPGVLSLS